MATINTEALATELQGISEQQELLTGEMEEAKQQFDAQKETIDKKRMSLSERRKEILCALNETREKIAEILASQSPGDMAIEVERRQKQSAVSTSKMTPLVAPPSISIKKSSTLTDDIKKVLMSEGIHFMEQLAERDEGFLKKVLHPHLNEDGLAQVLKFRQTLKAKQLEQTS